MGDSEVGIIMVIMVILVGVLTVNVLSNILSSVKELEEKPQPCRLHDWYEHINEKGEHRGLVCAKCGKVPQIESRDDEEDEQYD